MLNGYDYIIVGAGSAGCVLANRLSESGDATVLLIEAGPKDGSWQLSMPAALAFPLRSERFNWGYTTEPQEHLNDRRLYWPRGRVLGGSSSINGMVWIRGHPWDFDNWYAQGMDGWAYCQVLPYFKRLEKWSEGSDAYRGSDGLVGVLRGNYPNPLFDAYVEAGRQAGYPVSPDFNGRQFEGYGRFDMNIWKGRRQSSSKTYLEPAMARPNLTVMTEILVSKVLISNGQATGVLCRRGKNEITIEAAQEVLLCGGAINSPQVLMLSGVGDAQELRKHTIDVVADLPGVGQNLQDHLNTSVKYGCRQPVSLYGADRFPKNVLIGLQYFLFKTGAGATMHTEAGCFIKAMPDSDIPDIQHHFIPILVYDNGRKPADQHGFQCHVCPVRPESRGTVTLRSGNPVDSPVIQPNCMSTDRDLAMMIECIKVTRDGLRQPAMEPFLGPELFPGPDVKSDVEILDYVRESAVTCYHPSGTCKMGNDELAVVDETLKVHGVDNLRVIDASIMPELVSGNTNAAIMMMAELSADRLLGRTPETPIDVEIDGYQPIRTEALRETKGLEAVS